MASNPDLSIVIVHFKTLEYTRKCLESVMKWEPAAQTIVVDNASGDGSAEILSKEFPQCEWIFNAKNGGFAAGNNPGLARSRGEFVILLNSDTVLEDDSLSRCVQYMRERPKVGAVSPKLIGMDDKPQECAYAYPTVANLLGRTLGKKPASASPGNLWLAGTALMIRRAALPPNNFHLDENHFMYWEDCDISARIKKGGWQLEVVESAQIRHLGGASGGGPDSIRRPDLYLWYVWGEMRWAWNHLGLLGGLGYWFLDLVDVPRKFLRGMLHSQRRVELQRARSKAQALWLRLTGQSPQRP